MGMDGRVTAHWQLIGSQTYIAPLYTLLATTDSSFSLKIMWCRGCNWCRGWFGRVKGMDGRVTAHWQFIGSQTYIAPLYTLLATTDSSFSLKIM